MKKLLSLFTVLILLISLCACAQPQESVSTPESSSPKPGKDNVEKAVCSVFENNHLELPGGYADHTYTGKEYYFLSTAFAGDVNYISCLSENFNHKWTVQTPLVNVSTFSQIAVGEEAVYCLSPKSVGQDIYEITAHSVKDGALLWEKSFATDSPLINLNALKDHALVFVGGSVEEFCGLNLEENFTCTVFSIDNDGEAAVSDIDKIALSHSADAQITDYKAFLVYPDLKTDGYYVLISQNEQTLITKFNGENEPINSVTVSGSYKYLNKFSNTILVFSEDRIYLETEHKGATTWYAVTYCFNSDLELLFTADDGEFMNPLKNGESAYFESEENNFVHICDDNGVITQSYNVETWEMDYLCKTKNGYEAAGRIPSRYYEFDKDMKMTSFQRDEYAYFFVAADGEIIKVN